jgi:hypothetical protein
MTACFWFYILSLRKLKKDCCLMAGKAAAGSGLVQRTGAADGGVLIGSSVSPVINFINCSSLAIFRCHPRWEQHKVMRW